jgi:hypothetical protein
LPIMRKHYKDSQNPFFRHKHLAGLK